MRPYVIEVAFVFAAGFCVGAWLNERRHMEEMYPVVEETESVTKEEPKGVNVKLQDGKLVIAPRKKKRFFVF